MLSDPKPTVNHKVVVAGRICAAGGLVTRRDRSGHQVAARCSLQNGLSTSHGRQLANHVSGIFHRARLGNHFEYEPRTGTPRPHRGRRHRSPTPEASGRRARMPSRGNRGPGFSGRSHCERSGLLPLRDARKQINVTRADRLCKRRLVANGDMEIRHFDLFSQ